MDPIGQSHPSPREGRGRSRWAPVLEKRDAFPLSPHGERGDLLSMNTHGPIYGAEERQNERAATLSGLMGLLFVSPRVARSSQPWAERCNPFGIETSATLSHP